MNYRKSIATNAILNSIRQVCTILFPLITLPYASRVIQAENYGKINFATSFVSYFSIFAALGINTYAVREGVAIRRYKNKISLFSSQIFSINILSSIISYILLISAILISAKVKHYASLILIYSIGIILTTIGVEWVYAIYEDYLFITIRSISVQALSLICMFIFVKEAGDFYIYAIINVIANGGANIVSGLYASKYIKFKPTVHLDLKQHLKPLLILLGSAIAMVIYVNSDITILGIMVDDVSVGIYSVAVKIYTGVKQIINAIFIVTLPQVVLLLKEENKKGYNQLLGRIMTILIILLFPIMGGMFILSEDLIFLVAGETYLDGTISLQILSIALCFSIGAGFYANVILVANKKENKVLQSTLIAAVTNVLLNFLFVKLWKQNGAAFTTALSELIVLALGYYYSRRLAHPIIKRRDIVSIVIGTIIVIAICMVTRLVIENYIYRIILSVIVSCIVYMLVMIVSKNSAYLFLFSKIERHK